MASPITLEGVMDITGANHPIDLTGVMDITGVGHPITLVSITSCSHGVATKFRCDIGR
jgi:hypothetical protein